MITKKKKKRKKTPLLIKEIFGHAVFEVDFEVNYLVH